MDQQTKDHYIRNISQRIALSSVPVAIELHIQGVAPQERFEILKAGIARAAGIVEVAMSGDLTDKEGTLKRVAEFMGIKLEEEEGGSKT